MDRLISMAVFVAAVEGGSLVGAARRFGLSPSMAGKHVSALEDHLQVRLLQRSTRLLTLTDIGRSYYQRCKDIIEAVEQADSEAQNTQQRVQGRLCVAAPATFGALYLGNVVAGYMDNYPEVRVETVLSDHYADLLAESIDVAIRIGTLQDSDLIAQRLADCQMLLCAAPSFLQKFAVPPTLDNLRQAPRLAFNNAVSAGDWTLVDPQGNSHIIDGPLRLAANDMQILLAAALEGAGIVYGPGFVFARAIAEGKLQVLLTDHQTTRLAIYAVYPSRRHISLKLRSFVEHLKQSFGDTAPWDRALIKARQDVTTARDLSAPGAV